METQTGTVLLQTAHGADAEREDFAILVDAAAGGFDVENERIDSTITDDEDQTYVVTVTTEEPPEGSPIDFTARPTPRTWTWPST